MAESFQWLVEINPKLNLGAFKSELAGLVAEIEKVTSAGSRTASQFASGATTAGGDHIPSGPELAARTVAGDAYNQALTVLVNTLKASNSATTQLNAKVISSFAALSEAETADKDYVAARVKAAKANAVEEKILADAKAANEAYLQARVRAATATSLEAAALTRAQTANGEYIDAKIAETSASARQAAEYSRQAAVNEEYLTSKVVAAKANLEEAAAVQRELAADEAYVRATAEAAGARRLAAIADQKAANTGAGLGGAAERYANSFKVNDNGQFLDANNRFASVQSGVDAKKAADQARALGLIRAQQGEAEVAVESSYLSAQGALAEATLRRATIERVSATGAETEQSLIAQRRVIENELNASLRKEVAAAEKNAYEQGTVQGSLFQRITAQLKSRQGGDFQNPLEQSTLGQFLGNKALTTASFAVSGLALYGGLGLITKGIKDAEAFQTALLPLQQELVAIGKGDQFAGLQSAIQSTSVSTGQNAAKLADVSSRFVALFGDAKRAAVEVQSIGAIAAVSGADLTLVAEGAQAAYKNFGITAKELGNIAIDTRNRFGVPIAETLTFLGQVSPVASASGFDARQAAALAGSIAAQAPSKSGAAEAESVNRILPDLIANTTKLIKLNDDAFGGKLFKDADLAAGDLNKFLVEVATNYDKLNKAQQNQFIADATSSRNKGILIALLANHTAFLDANNSATNISTLLADALAKSQDTLAFKIKALGQEFGRLVYTIFNGGLGTALGDIASGLGGIIKAGQTIIDLFDKLGPFKEIILAGVALIGLTKLAPVLGSIAGQAAATTGVTGAVLKGVGVPTAAAAETGGAAEAATITTGAATTSAATWIAAVEQTSLALQAAMGIAVGELEVGAGVAATELATGGAAGALGRVAPVIPSFATAAPVVGAEALGPAGAASAAEAAAAAGAAGAAAGGAGAATGISAALTAAAASPAVVIIGALIAQSFIKKAIDAIPGSSASIPGESGHSFGAAAKNILFPNALDPLHHPLQDVPGGGILEEGIGLLNTVTPFGIPKFLLPGQSKSPAQKAADAAIKATAASEADTIQQIEALDPSKGGLSKDQVDALAHGLKGNDAQKLNELIGRLEDKSPKLKALIEAHNLSTAKGLAPKSLDDQASLDQYVQTVATAQAQDITNIQDAFQQGQATLPDTLSALKGKSAAFANSAAAGSATAATQIKQLDKTMQSDVQQALEGQIADIQDAFSKGDVNIGDTIGQLDAKLAELKTGKLNGIQLTPAEIKKENANIKANIITNISATVSEIKNALSQGDITIAEFKSQTQPLIDALLAHGDRKAAEALIRDSQNTISAGVLNFVHSQAAMIDLIGGKSGNAQDDKINLYLQTLKNPDLKAADKNNLITDLLTAEKQKFTDYVSSLPNDAAKAAALRKGFDIPSSVTQAILSNNLVESFGPYRTTIDTISAALGQNFQNVADGIAAIATAQGIDAQKAALIYVKGKQTADNAILTSAKHVEAVLVAAYGGSGGHQGESGDIATAHAAVVAAQAVADKDAQAVADLIVAGGGAEAQAVLETLHAAVLLDAAKVLAARAVQAVLSAGNVVAFQHPGGDKGANQATNQAVADAEAKQAADQAAYDRANGIATNGSLAGASPTTSIAGDTTQANNLAKTAADQTRTLLKAKRAAEVAKFKALYANDPIKLAEEDLTVAGEAIAQALSEAPGLQRDADLLNAQAQQITAQKALQAAVAAAFLSQIAIAKAVAGVTGDLLQAAKLGLQEAQAKLFIDAAAGAGVATLNADRAAIITQAGAVSEQVVKGPEALIDFNLSIKKISQSQAVAQLTALEQTAEILYAQHKISLATVEELQKKIFDLKQSLQANLQFNLPTDLKLPTLYEAKRVDQSGGLSHYSDNRTITITLNANSKVDANAAVNQIIDAVNAPPRVGIRPHTY